VSITLTPRNITQTPESFVTSAVPAAPLASTLVSTATSTIVSTPTVQAAPILQGGYRSNFFLSADIRSAVEKLIQRNVQRPELQALLVKADRYPDLASNGLLSAIETPDAACSGAPKRLRVGIDAQVVLSTDTSGLRTDPGVGRQRVEMTPQAQ
jgi:hypothetical protein